MKVEYEEEEEEFKQTITIDNIDSGVESETQMKLKEDKQKRR